MEKIVDVKYISYWDGCDDIKTNAKINRLTGEVIEIESVDVDDLYEEYEICIGEFIKYEDGSMEQVVSNDDSAEYFIVSKSGELYKDIKINNIKYTILKEMHKDDIHKICGIAY